MMVNSQTEFDQVSGVCWLATGEMESLAMCVFETLALAKPSSHRLCTVHQETDPTGTDSRNRCFGG
jgi:hypothetical protein